MAVEVKKVPGGFEIDGLALLKGKCGCTSIARCCHSVSKVKKKSENAYEFEAQLSDPDTADNFEWGYTVQKDGITVTVSVKDARDKVISSAYLPPAASAWVEKGWTVVEKNGDREDGVVWRCAMCKWLYKDNEQEVPFEQLPEDWKCPRCGVLKREFERMG